MKHSLEKLLEEATGYSVPLLVNADSPINPFQRSEIAPVLLEEIEAIVLRVDPEKCEQSNDFKAVICYAHLSEKALRTIAGHETMRRVYCLHMVKLYIRECFPDAVEEAIVNLGNDKLVDCLSDCGHVWSPLALEIIGINYDEMTFKTASKVKMTYWEWLKYLGEKRMLRENDYYAMPMYVRHDFEERKFITWMCTWIRITPEGIRKASEIAG